MIPLLSPLAALLTWQLFAMGGALAGVPILIHLLSRRKVRRVEWAAMHWLLAAMKRHQRRLRMENWLILLLRVMAIVLLGLALARPVLTDGAGILGRQKRSVYLVLDNSFSTQAKLDARAVTDRIKREADLVLESIGPDDSTVVILTNDPDEDATHGLDPHVLMGRSVGDEGAARAREIVAGMRTRDAPANWVKTLQALQEQMRTEDVNRHVVLVTDLQAKDWLRAPRERLDDAGGTHAEGTSAEGTAPVKDDSSDRLRKELIRILRRPATVTVVDVGGQDRRDLAVLNVERRGGQDPFVGRTVRMAVTVANFGRQAVVGAQLDVRVDDGDRRHAFPVPDLPAASTSIRVPKPGLATVQVDLPRSTFRAPGSHTLRLTITPPRGDPGADALALSSDRRLALQVRRRVHVLAWTRTSTSEKQMEAESYLRGIYEGEVASGSGTPPQGPPPIYEYEAAPGEEGLRRRLEQRSSRPIDLLVLANVVPRNAKLLAELRAYVREGGGLLVFTGDQCRPDPVHAAFWADDPADRLLPFQIAGATVRARDATDAGHFRLDLDFQENPHPLAEPFTNVKADDWIKRVPPKVWGRTHFLEETGLAPEKHDGEGSRAGDSGSGGADERGSLPVPGRVVLRFRPEGGRAVGLPAVVSGRFGAGRTVWVGTSIDNGWLDRSVLFLPVFLDEAAMFLTRPASEGRNLTIGGILRAAIPARAEQVRIVPPGGGAVSPRRRTPEGVTTSRVEYEHDVLGRSGVWALTYEVPSLTGGEADKVRELFAVNPDPYEGLLLAASHEAVASGIPAELDLHFMTGYDEIGADIREAREGEITRWLLYLLLAVLLLESFLAMRFGRRGQQQATDGGAGA